ncbi:MAG: RNA polymerase sigma factor [bacterium]|nr:RNA polymerase sigma factor [bacterium]
MMLESTICRSTDGREEAAHLDALRLEQVYREHGRRLLAIAASIVPRDEANEVLDDALLSWWRSPSAQDPVRGSLIGWLAIVVRRKALDRRRAALRRSARDQRSFDASRFERDAAEAACVERDVIEVARLREAVATLPEEQRRALTLAYFGGHTHTEIAEALALPLGTVKKRIALAMRRLRRELAEGDDRASG